MIIDALKSNLFRKNISKKKSEDLTFDDIKLIHITDSKSGENIDDNKHINLTVRELRNICKNCVKEAFEMLIKEGLLDIEYYNEHYQ